MCGGVFSLLFFFSSFTLVTFDWGLIWVVRMKNQLLSILPPVYFAFSIHIKWYSRVYSFAALCMVCVCVCVCVCHWFSCIWLPSWALFNISNLKNVCAAVSSNSKFNADYIVSWQRQPAHTHNHFIVNHMRFEPHFIQADGWIHAAVK